MRPAQILTCSLAMIVSAACGLDAEEHTATPVTANPAFAAATPTQTVAPRAKPSATPANTPTATPRPIIKELNSFQIINCAEEPSFLGCIPWAISFNQDYAYVVLGEFGLHVVDISDPTSLMEVSRLPIKEFASNIYVDSGLAYITGGGFGLPGGYLHIVDVSDPAEPGIISSTFIVEPAGVFARGDQVFVSRVGLMVFDASNPASPQLQGEVFHSHTVTNDVIVHGNLAFVNGRYEDTWGLEVIDVSDPELPEVVGFMETSTEQSHMFATENYLFMAARESGLCVVDIGDPSSPKEVALLDTPSIAFDVFIHGNYAFVADVEGGVRVIDITEPLNPREITFIDTSGLAFGVYSEGSHVYVVDASPGESHLRVYEFRPPAHDPPPSN